MAESAGKTIGGEGDSFAARHEVLGKHEDGSARKWSDLASDWGMAARGEGKHWYNDVAGAAAAGGGALVGTLGTVGSAGASLVERAGSAVGNVASDAMNSFGSWLYRGVNDIYRPY